MLKKNQIDSNLIHLVDSFINRIKNYRVIIHPSRGHGICKYGSK